MANLSAKTKQRLAHQYGQWALVTGATSGIGKALATQLASAGLNVIITGRRQKKLEDLESDLFHDYGVEILSVVGDLSHQEGVKELLDSVRHLDIGMAILNAGFGTSGSILNTSLEAELNMLDLNCKSLYIMTHYFASYFAEKGKGGLILLSSMVGFQGVPNASHYAATKAYVQSLGEAIAVELKPKGVDVLCAAPGPVESGFSERADMKMGKALRPEDVAAPILSALGRKTTVLPGFLTKFLMFSLGMIPRSWRVKIMGNVMGGFTQHQQMPAKSLG